MASKTVKKVEVLHGSYRTVTKDKDGNPVEHLVFPSGTEITKLPKDVDLDELKATGRVKTVEKDT